MYINGKWFTEPQLASYIDDLQTQLKEKDEKLALAKTLLKSAIECLSSNIACKADGESCDFCEYDKESCDYDNRFRWEHHIESLSLIKEALGNVRE